MSSPPAKPTRTARIRAWLGPSFSAEHRAAFATEIAEGNRRRFRVLLPIMVLVHFVHMAVFWVSDADRLTLDPQIAHWRNAVAMVHLWSLVGAAVLTALVLRVKNARWLGPIVSTFYLLHAAAIIGADQIAITSVTPFVGYALGVAIIALLTPRQAVAVYAIGLTAFVAAMTTMQASGTVRLAMLPNGFSSGVMSIALVWLMHTARQREFAQRLTIEQQREALELLNLGLERRVSDQIAEIVAHATQVDLLNAQLRAQVRERSNELSMALAKLARARERDGSLKPGTKLGGRFAIERLIGTGGMGAVYAGRDETSNGAVAIKVIQAASSRQLDALHLFIREAGTTAAVNHPAVVGMIHVDVSEDGMLYQVQELVDGETLESRLRKDKAWDPGTVARLGAVLCDALAAAHSRDVIHCDVKPSNVMLTRRSPGLRLLDFGIAKLYAQGSSDDGRKSETILGTPAFMAPEQLTGSRVSDRADCYAIGVMLFELLTGSHPFGEQNAKEKIASHLHTPPPDVRAQAPLVPVELAALVAGCLRKSANERPASSELAAKLAAFADAQEVPALDALESADRLRDAEAIVTRSRATAVVAKT